MKRTIDGAINGGGLDTAKSALQKLPDLIDKEAQVTNLEKELNRSLAKYYELRIARKTAKEAKDKAALATATDELLKFVEEMMKKHKDLLEPAEVSDFQTRMRRYRFERDL
jgi:molecular chaperone GrpE (heat shock protein)